MHRVEISDPIVSAEYEKNKSAFYMLSADMEEWYLLWSKWLQFREAKEYGKTARAEYQEVLFERLARFLEQNSDNFKVGQLDGTNDLHIVLPKEGRKLSDRLFGEVQKAIFIPYKEFLDRYFDGGLTATDIRHFFDTHPETKIRES